MIWKMIHTLTDEYLLIVYDDNLLGLGQPIMQFRLTSGEAVDLWQDMKNLFVDQDDAE